MQDRRVLGSRVIAEVNISRREINNRGTAKLRMRLRVEFRVVQVRYGEAHPVQLDYIRAFDDPQQHPGTAFIYPQDWGQRIQGRAMQIQPCLRYLSNCGGINCYAYAFSI